MHRTGCIIQLRKLFSSDVLMSGLVCSNECQGKPKGCKKGKSGGMHIYAYYSNMQGNKGCGDEYTFKSGSKAMVVKANKDYRVQLVVKLNSGSAHSLPSLTQTLPHARSGFSRGF